MATSSMLSMQGISKQFPGIVALDNVDFHARSGEVHCLLGHNGAGKSTLMKILSGVETADSGTISLDGEIVTIRNPQHARELGIRTIFQELSLAPALSVAENIYLERLPRTRLGLVDRKHLNREAAKILEILGVEVDPEERVEHLSVATCQLVEVARAIAFRARVLVMDEPTASLSARETENLFHTVKRLKGEGLAIIYISHRMEEIQQIGDTITVLRDGKLVKTLPAAGASTEQVVELMLGASLEEQFPPPTGSQNTPVLEVFELSQQGAFEDINFTLRGQEILGITGQVGAGVLELAHSLFGNGPLPQGRIKVNGEQLQHSPLAAIKAGVGFIPEDRRNAGLVLGHTIRENMALPSLPLLSRGTWLQLSRERSEMMSISKKLHMQMSGLEQPAGQLSGGNQQKIVVAKWLANRSKILLFAEPTRGVDVGARAEIYRLISEQVAGGASAILFSSDLQEVIGMCDRVLVMRKGRIVAEVGRGASEQHLLALAMGSVDGEMNA